MRARLSKKTQLSHSAHHSLVSARCTLLQAKAILQKPPAQLSALGRQVAGFLAISCPFALTDALRERWDATQRPRSLHLLWGVITGDYERGLSR